MPARCNACLIREEALAHKGELVIDSWEVKQLVGVGADDGDWFWVFRDIQGVHSYLSCCGGFTPLKGKIDAAAYASMERAFRWNARKPTDRPRLVRLRGRDSRIACYCHRICRNCGHLSEHKAVKRGRGWSVSGSAGKLCDAYGCRCKSYAPVGKERLK